MRDTLFSMPLKRTTRHSNDVRAPAVPRGNAVIVTRYREDNAKVALVNPEDLTMLEESNDLLQAIAELDPLPVSDIARKALGLEESSHGDARVEDPQRIAAILEL